MTDMDKCQHIIETVDGCMLEEGLSTIGLALVHLCLAHGYSKQDMLAAIGSQFDLYQKSWQDRKQREMN